MRYCEKDKFYSKFPWTYCPICGARLKDNWVCAVCGKPLSNNKCANCDSGLLILGRAK